MSRTQILLRLPEELKQRLEGEATAEGRSLNNYLVYRLGGEEALPEGEQLEQSGDGDGSASARSPAEVASDARSREAKPTAPQSPSESAALSEPEAGHLKSADDRATSGSENVSARKPFRTDFKKEPKKKERRR